MVYRTIIENNLSSNDYLAAMLINASPAMILGGNGYE